MIYVPFDSRSPEEREKIKQEAIEWARSRQSEFSKEMDRKWKEWDKERDEMRARMEEQMRTSTDPEVMLQWALYQKQLACKHLNVPRVKSFYSEEIVQRGECPDCGVIFQEMD